MPSTFDDLDIQSEEGLAQELEGFCRFYKDDKQKIACIDGAKNALSFIHTGLNQKAQQENFMSMSELDDVSDDLKDKHGKPDRKETPPIKEPTVAKAR